MKRVLDALGLFWDRLFIVALVFVCFAVDWLLEAIVPDREQP